MPYTFPVHRHRLASWCAATAARSSKICRFPVSAGVTIIEESGLCDWNDRTHLPSANDFDEAHKKMRRKVIATSELVLIEKKFTTGIAAKLINCYLKVIYIGPGENEDPVLALVDKG